MPEIEAVPAVPSDAAPTALRASDALVAIAPKPTETKKAAELLGSTDWGKVIENVMMEALRNPDNFLKLARAFTKGKFGLGGGSNDILDAPITGAAPSRIDTDTGRALQTESTSMPAQKNNRGRVSGYESALAILPAPIVASKAVDYVGGLFELLRSAKPEEVVDLAKKILSVADDRDLERIEQLRAQLLKAEVPNAGSQ